jgi:hypothetical protein
MVAVETNFIASKSVSAIVVGAKALQLPARWHRNGGSDAVFPATAALKFPVYRMIFICTGEKLYFILLSPR